MKLDFVTYHDLAEINQVISRIDPLDGRNNRSRDKDYDYQRFSGTPDWEHAYQLFMKGDRESFELIKQKRALLTKLQQALITRPNHKPVANVVGVVPNVPNFIKGLPTSMIDYQPVTKKYRIVRIYYNRGAASQVSTDQLAEFGVYFSSLINGLELAGYRIELWVGSLCINLQDKIYSGWRVRLKKAQEPLNLYRLAFSLVNPSFLRRIDFAICEREPRLTDITNQSYGRIIERQMDYLDKEPFKDMIVVDYNTLAKLKNELTTHDTLNMDKYLTYLQNLVRESE